MNRRIVGIIAASMCLCVAAMALAVPQDKKKSTGKKPVKSSGKVVTTKSGLKYEDLKVGTGASPKDGQMVTVHYTGWLTNGTKFDSSKDHGQPYEFAIGRRKVIAGWDEGVLTMKIGGKRKLTVPPALGYGDNGYPPVIPANATLIFEVELLAVK